MRTGFPFPISPLDLHTDPHIYPHIDPHMEPPIDSPFGSPLGETLVGFCLVDLLRCGVNLAS